MHQLRSLLSSLPPERVSEVTQLISAHIPAREDRPPPAYEQLGDFGIPTEDRSPSPSLPPRPKQPHPHVCLQVWPPQLTIDVGTLPSLTLSGLLGLCPDLEPRAPPCPALTLAEPEQEIPPEPPPQYASGSDSHASDTETEEVWPIGKTPKRHEALAPTDDGDDMAEPLDMPIDDTPTTTLPQRSSLSEDASHNVAFSSLQASLKHNSQSNSTIRKGVSTDSYEELQKMKESITKRTDDPLDKWSSMMRAGQLATEAHRPSMYKPVTACIRTGCVLDRLPGSLTCKRHTCPVCNSEKTSVALTCGLAECMLVVDKQREMNLREVMGIQHTLHSQQQLRRRSIPKRTQSRAIPDDEVIDLDEDSPTPTPQGAMWANDISPKQQFRPNPNMSVDQIALSLTKMQKKKPAARLGRVESNSGLTGLRKRTRKITVIKKKAKMKQFSNTANEAVAIDSTDDDGPQTDEEDIPEVSQPSKPKPTPKLNNNVQNAKEVRDAFQEDESIQEEPIEEIEEPASEEDLTSSAQDQSKKKAKKQKKEKKEKKDKKSKKDKKEKKDKKDKKPKEETVKQKNTTPKKKVQSAKPKPKTAGQSRQEQKEKERRAKLRAERKAAEAAGGEPAGDSGGSSSNGSLFDASE